MTRQEIKDIKNAWARSLNWNDFNEASEKLELDPGVIDSLLEYSFRNSHKFVK